METILTKAKQRFIKWSTGLSTQDSPFSNIATAQRWPDLTGFVTCYTVRVSRGSHPAGVDSASPYGGKKTGIPDQVLEKAAPNLSQETPNQ